MGPVLVTGATGFVGSRLLATLARREVEVRAGSRRAPGRSTPRVSWVQLDVNRPETLLPALDGCEAAYFLVHALGTPGFEQREERAAASFASAAEHAGVQRIVYLGGVAPSARASTHLRSRLRTGALLRAGRVPTFELRAGMIIGVGSESWRIVRDLATRLPVMVLPRWMHSRSQPVAIDDVLFALAGALDVPLERAGVYDLPGPEVLSAREILARVARLNGTAPVMVEVPVVSPRLSSHWIRWVTRAHGDVARELVEGLREDLLASQPPFWTLLPPRDLVPFDVAARRALLEEGPNLPLRSLVAEALAHFVARKMPATPR